MTEAKFATDYESAKKVLSYMAFKFNKRLFALGFHADYEEVYQDNCVIYTKALKTYSPDSGIAFATYLTRCLCNDFNDRVEKMVAKRESIKIVDVLDEETGENNIDNIGSSEDVFESPEDLAVLSDGIRERVSSLSPLAKLVVRELIAPSNDVKRTMLAMQAHSEYAMTQNQRVYYPEEVNIKVIRKHYGIKANKFNELKAEFVQKLGVSFD